MKLQRNKIVRVLFRPALVVVAVGVAFTGVFIFWQNSQANDIATLLPQFEAAAAYEAEFQSLPEEKSAPGALKIPILIYHSVRPIDPKDSLLVWEYEVSPQSFEAQLKYLKDNGYTAISLQQVAADLKAGTTFPVLKPVVLTFDDGWENQYTYAFPLLQKYRMTATFFIYTNPIDSNKAWLTWDQLKEMSAAGMDIEDHSISHPLFRGLVLSEVKRQVEESKNIIEEHIGKPVLDFASPYGYSDPEIISIVKAAGYITYRTTYKGVYQDNPMRLRGLLMSDDTSYLIQELNK